MSFKNVKVINLKKIENTKGAIIKILNKKDKNFKKFGEIYFSSVNPKFIKAWHLHEKMTLNYVAVYGKVKLVLFDDRKNSSSNGVLEEIFLSSNDYKLVSIPPMIWNGYASEDKNIAIIANCSDIPHDKNEIIRIPFDDSKIPYIWKFNF